MCALFTPYALFLVPGRVLRAVKILTDPSAGVRLKASSVTVSTVGLVPEIERFCKDASNGASLAISLHAVTDDIRDKVRPHVHQRFVPRLFSASWREHCCRFFSGHTVHFLVCFSCDRLYPSREGYLVDWQNGFFLRRHHQNH